MRGFYALGGRPLSDDGGGPLVEPQALERGVAQPPVRRPLAERDLGDELRPDPAPPRPGPRPRRLRHERRGELHEGIEGLVHISELDEKRVDRPEDVFKPGDTHPMKIIKLSEAEKKIGLSIKAAKSYEYRSDYEAYRESNDKAPTTALGEALRAVLPLPTLWYGVNYV